MEAASAWTRQTLYAAVADGDIAVISAYFAQHHVRALVDETEALIVANAPEITSFAWSSPGYTGSFYPWYFTRPPQSPTPWGAPKSLFGIAITNGHYDVIRWFLAPERALFMGATLAKMLPNMVQFAAGTNNCEMVGILLESKVWVKHIPDARKQELLDQQLCSCGSTREDDMIQYLLACGANVTAQQTLNAGACYMTEHQAELLAVEGARIVGANVVDGACMMGNPTGARRLLALGADWGNCNLSSDERPPLHWAAENGDHEMVTILLHQGYADVDARDTEGATALMKILRGYGGARCFLGAPQVTELLLDAGADVTVKDVDGKTALHHAVESDFSEVVELLLQHGADPNERDNAGNSPLLCVQLDLMDEDTTIVEKLGLMLEYSTDPMPFCVSKREELLQSSAGRVFVEEHAKYFKSTDLSRHIPAVPLTG